MSVLKDKERPEGSRITRRDILKGALSLPVLGLFGQQLLKKKELDAEKKKHLIDELQLDGLGVDGEKTEGRFQDGKRIEERRPGEAPAIQPQTTGKPAGELIRLGIIGCGTRGEQLARALGFARPEWIAGAKEAAEKNKLDTRLKDWLNQEDLNVAVTAVCDVFELRLQEGSSAVQSSLRPGSGNSGKASPAPAQYRDYHDLLARSDIDAVIIATPDFQHAPIALAAIAAGKHVYCEKCMTRTEEETHALRASVKKSNIVFQLGHQYPQNACYGKAKEIIAKNILGKITLIETSTNRNTNSGAWVRHLDSKGQPRPGNPQSIDWKRWLGGRPEVPFSIDRYYNWSKWWDYATGLSGQLYCHEVDIVNQLLGVGIPASVVASGGIYFHKDNREIPDIWTVTCEFPDHDLTHVYSATLANSRKRARLFMGHDAVMELSDTLQVLVDGDSTRYQRSLRQGNVAPNQTIISYQPGMGTLDMVTSASEKFYASRGLVYTYHDGRRVDITYLHLKEWLDCIRNGGTPSCPIDKAFEATITCHMATRSYREQRRVTWDKVQQKIV